MSARDELFQLILGRTTTKAVERILAAGYRKPRAIATVAELEDVSVGTVLQSEQGAIWERFGTYWFETSSTRAYRDDDISLPATVLYEPAA